jgi:hypothetical protein
VRECCSVVLCYLRLLLALCPVTTTPLTLKMKLVVLQVCTVIFCECPCRE